MAEVVSTLSQLTHAFKTHLKVSQVQKEEISHLLLLFYATECGLKARYLRSYLGRDTSDFPNLPVGKKFGHGHDLWLWIRELKIANFGFTNNPDRPISQLHEQLRYGTFSNTAFAEKQIKFLRDLSLHLKDKI